MKDRISGHALANTAMMRGPRRRDLPVLLLQVSLNNTVTMVCNYRYENYWVMPAPDRETAIRARIILKGRGWRDYGVPHEFAQTSFSLAPPNDSKEATSNETRETDQNKEGDYTESRVIHPSAEDVGVEDVGVKNGSVPDYFQDEGEAARRSQVKWLEHHTGITNKFISKFLHTSEGSLRDWLEHRESLSPEQQEMLGELWQTMLHLLSFLNFDAERVRNLLDHKFPSEVIKARESPLSPSWRL